MAASEPIATASVDDASGAAAAEPAGTVQAADINVAVNVPSPVVESIVDEPPVVSAPAFTATVTEPTEPAVDAPLANLPVATFPAVEHGAVSAEVPATENPPSANEPALWFAEATPETATPETAPPGVIPAAETVSPPEAAIVPPSVAPVDSAALVAPSASESPTPCSALPPASNLETAVDGELASPAVAVAASPTVAALELVTHPSAESQPAADASTPFSVAEASPVLTESAPGPTDAATVDASVTGPTSVGTSSPEAVSAPVAAFPVDTASAPAALAVGSWSDVPNEPVLSAASAQTTGAVASLANAALANANPPSSIPPAAPQPPIPTAPSLFPTAAPSAQLGAVPHPADVPTVTFSAPLEGSFPAGTGVSADDAAPPPSTFGEAVGSSDVGISAGWPDAATGAPSSALPLAASASADQTLIDQTSIAPTPAALMPVDHALPSFGAPLATLAPVDPTVPAAPAGAVASQAGSQPEPSESTASPSGAASPSYDQPDFLSSGAAATEPVLRAPRESSAGTIRVSQLWVVLVLSYASAVTVMLAYLVFGARMGFSHQLESLPDVLPKETPAGKIRQELVSQAAGMPPGHTLKLGESARFGNVRVTPLRVVREPVEFVYYEDDKPDMTRPPGDPILKLWLKVENVSRDQEFMPLGKDLVFFARHRAANNPTHERSNQFVCPLSRKSRDGAAVLLYPYASSDVWDLKHLREKDEHAIDRMLAPGETWETYLPTDSGGLDRLTGQLVWRVHLRKGLNAKSERGVTTLFEVVFHSDQIESRVEPASAPDGEQAKDKKTDS